jgi:hypothetical protein
MIEKSEWTISTLKEHFEQQLKALESKCKADTDLLTSRANNAAEALDKQAREYERRLSDLNGEAGRIKEANARNVSREVYEGDKKSDDEWKRRMEGLVSDTVGQSEFRSYKDSTSTALTLQAGSREGMKVTGQTVLAVILGLAAIAGIVFGITAHSGSLPAPIIYVTPSTPPPPGDPATVKVKP